MSEEIENFFKNVEEVGKKLPTIENLVKKGYYEITTKRLTDLEDIVRFISIFISFQNNEKLTGRKLETLAYYLKYGYSSKTKDKILKNCKIKDSNLNNVNCELRKLNYIIADQKNERSNRVNPDLLDFVNYMVQKKGKYIVVEVKDA